MAAGVASFFSSGNLFESTFAFGEVTHYRNDAPFSAIPRSRLRFLAAGESSWEMDEVALNTKDCGGASGLAMVGDPCEWEEELDLSLSWVC